MQIKTYETVLTERGWQEKEEMLTIEKCPECKALVCVDYNDGESKDFTEHTAWHEEILYQAMKYKSPPLYK